ncbi:hypothetical protein AA105894_1588 [Asaia spathodeae NBRC 105894]|nr:hypothetical protein AA105894_1588 [Asaia spathodeae NBRC 105894]
MMRRRVELIEYSTALTISASLPLAILWVDLGIEVVRRMSPLIVATSLPGQAKII